MRISDTMLGGFLIAFGAALAGYSQTFPAIPGQTYGAAIFPTAVAIGFAGCGGLLVMHGLRSNARHLGTAEWMLNRRAVVGVALAVLAITGYILLAPVIGFIPVMAAMLLGLFLFLRVRWPMAVVLAAVVTVVIHGVFAGLLLVPLPIGLFPRISW
ncbi:tripartite tricarboxylate transporter TctB family protein [Microbaculum sp. FT89]|uniref:tripartite tricarboxylate transporter TctB family protein n=1 Tax=Microbaculum sp. FT89 TaxID=3447298 RepID=UPI003F538B76